MSEELTRLSAARLVELIRAREVSPVEVVEAHIRRIERLNPRLNALVALAPDAFEQARALEDRIARGLDAGALAGLPVTVKDTIDARGMKATAGALPFKERVADRDALGVARLRAAGAVVFGKTNCAELALDYTSENPLHGRTLNPHDAECTPGGSSGGCASAVAARLTTGSVGSDLVGSIRIPAHFCGVVGLKPTAGRVPSSGHLPPLVGPYTLAASLGPIARTVEDVELFFDALTLSDSRRGRDEETRRDEARRGGRTSRLEGARAAWCVDIGDVPIAEETRRALADVVACLEAAGATVREERPPGFERGTDLWLALFTRATERFITKVFEGREHEAGQSARSILERAKRTGAKALTLDDYTEVWEERDRLRAELSTWMESTPLIITPVGATAAYRHEESRRVRIGGATYNTFRAFSFAHAANLFDLPSVSVPAGRTREGLPIGVQITGRPHDERSVLAAARVVEEVCGGDNPPKDFLPRA